MVYGLADRPFKGQRPQERPKSFLACGSRAAAEVGRLQCLCVLCSTVSARARALCVSAAGLYHPPPPPFYHGSLQGSVQWLLYHAAVSKC